MRIAITGGAGYVGSRLVPHLLSKGHIVTVLDTFWYGDYLGENQNLFKIQGDIRDSQLLRKAFDGADVIIHLACISNDPSFEMNPKLGEEINHTCFRNIIDLANITKPRLFIYASSSSVYGVSRQMEITERAPKNPLTDYSRFKLMCEEELQEHYKGVYTIIRPATVCGYAPRQRLDLVVNKLAIDALLLKKITIFGRANMRPNIHIMDMVRAYAWVIESPESDIANETFNVGFFNLKLHEIADLVKATLKDDEIQIKSKPSEDRRSYRVNSDKIMDKGFLPIFAVEDAVTSLKDNLHLLSNPLENPEYYNIKKMKELAL